MFAKLKKKIAEEAATAPRTSVRIPRTTSKESITSMGADSGDDLASDGSSSRDDLSQVLRRNDQMRRLEAKLSDYAEQLRLMQKTKKKLEFALETHQDSSMRKLQDQNESHQASRAKMAEGMALALEKKDQEWMGKMSVLEKEKEALREQVEEMAERSLNMFQKRDDRDELQGFQQQELAKLLRREEQLGQWERDLEGKEAELQAARRSLAQAQGRLQVLGQQHQESCQLNTELEIEREELLVMREEAESRTRELERHSQQLQAVIQQVSEDFQKSQAMVASLETSLNTLKTEHNILKLHQEKAAVTEEDKELMLTELQAKVSTLERRLQGDLSLDQHLQEVLDEKRGVEQRLEKTREELVKVRTSQADTVSALEGRIAQVSGNVGELQTLLRHKDDSSKAYRERTDAQIAALERQAQDSGAALRRSEQETSDQRGEMSRLQAEWGSEKASLEQQVALERQHRAELAERLQKEKTDVQTDCQSQLAALSDRISELEQERTSVLRERDAAGVRLQSSTEELAQARAELGSRQTVSVEIAKALEDTRRQKEELQVQVADLTTSHEATLQELANATEQLTQREEEIKTFHNELQAARITLSQLQAKLERQRAQGQQREAHLQEEVLCKAQQLDSCQSRISFLEVEVETLSEQLKTPEPCSSVVHNGSVMLGDLDHLQKINRDLEQQLADKNISIKQLLQRLAELKRTLQKELKLKPDPEAEWRAADGRLCPDPPPSSSSPMAAAPPTAPPPPHAPASSYTVTNTSDFNDSREINFEYLKHVVLKFMSCREAEAFHLIRAVSMLLNFSREEEDMLKQTLEYKMSWFGSKPSPKGIIRPSISGAATHWS